MNCFKETGQVLSVALINPAYQELARQLTGTHGEKKHSGNWPRERAQNTNGINKANRY